MKRSSRRTRGVLAVVLSLAIAVAGFLVAGSPASSATAKGTVSLRTTKLGPVLVTAAGRTLYLFEKDKGGRSSCSGMCATYWPPLLSAAKPTAGSGVKSALLGRVRRSDGKLQVTYNKHPLYMFADDKAAGQVNGQNINAFGADWYAVSAKGAKVTKTVQSSTTTQETSTESTTSTGGTKTYPGY